MTMSVPREIRFALGAVLLLAAAVGAEEGIGFGRAAPTPRQDAVLAGVLRAVHQTASQGRVPVCIFDLDATLFEAGCRHKAIFAEFARANRERYPGMERQVAGWVPDDLPYAVGDMIRQLGVTSETEFQRLFGFWRQRFFSNEYLRHDHPIWGAVPFVRALGQSGATIIYLTGRVESKMQRGSLATLRRWGFPVDLRRGVLLMASKSGVEDDHFKGSPEIRKAIAAIGTVVAIFDNEPGNCNALQKSFPDALTVLLDTNHSPGAPAPATGIAVISNYRRLWPAETPALCAESASDRR